MAAGKTNPGPLLVESLEATLKSVTFDASRLGLWQTMKPRCACPWYFRGATPDGDVRVHLFNLLHKLIHKP